jgi:hypothetical protein
MNVKKIFVMLGLMIILVATAACSAGGSEVPQTGPGTQAPVEGTPVLDDAMRQQVVNFLATELNVAADQIELGDIQSMEWPDSCLGLGGAAESCAAVITPGYQISATIAGQEYVVRTDQLASVLRLEGDAGAQ